VGYRRNMDRQFNLNIIFYRSLIELTIVVGQNWTTLWESAIPDVNTMMTPAVYNNNESSIYFATYNTSIYFGTTSFSWYSIDSSTGNWTGTSQTCSSGCDSFYDVFFTPGGNSIIIYYDPNKIRTICNSGYEFLLYTKPRDRSQFQDQDSSSFYVICSGF
jgi:hypothetical protein